MPETAQGVGASPGLAAGPALAMGRPPKPPAPHPVTDAAKEIAAADEALAAVVRNLRERAGAATTSAGGEILQAQAELALDPVLHESVASRVQQGQDAAHALQDTFAEHRAVFVAAGGYLAERAADLDDLSDRALAALIGAPMPGIPDPGHPFVLVAEDLAPADTAGLDPTMVLAIVTERGGPTSHTAILARALGIPAIVGCPGALNAAGRLVTVDGGTGLLRVGVTETEVADVLTRIATELAAPAAAGGPGRTADGHEAHLMVNIGSADDLAGVDLTGVAGVGLLRTEFLFLGRTDEPSVDEQADAYAAVFNAVTGGHVVVRTLDAGADKPLPFLAMPEEPNPALGVRGLRVARTRPETLDRQLAAIAAAASRTSAAVWVMAPMVSTAVEAAQFVAQARAHGLGTAGVMVEVPSAALRAAQLLRSADFLSIGTNDLAQYTMAADRQSGDLPDLLDPWQPAVLQLIATCAAAGQDSGKPVGICGEAAADPLLAPILVGLGVTSLSMSPRGLAAVRASLARHTLADCRRLAEAALQAEDAWQARAVTQEAQG